MIVVSDKSAVYLRIIVMFLLVEVGYLIFYHNVVGCHVYRAAHSVYPLLNSIVARNLVGLDYRMKIIGLIEKFSGPKVGFTCFDFFPVTNYEFYLLVINCAKLFILFAGLFKDCMG